MLDGRCGQELRGASSSSRALWPRLAFRRSSRREGITQTPELIDDSRVASGSLACSSVSCCCANPRAAHVVVCPAERLEVESGQSCATPPSSSTRRAPLPPLQLQQQQQQQQQREPQLLDGPYACAPEPIGPNAAPAAAATGSTVGPGGTLGGSGNIGNGAPSAGPLLRDAAGQLQRWLLASGGNGGSPATGGGGKSSWPSPQQLTKSIGRCGCWQDLCAILDEHSARMNVVHVTAVATRLTRFPPPVLLPPPADALSGGSGRGAVRQMEDASRRRQGQQQGTGVAEVVEWADFLRSVLALVEAQAAALDARGIANISWALAKVLQLPYHYQHQQMPLSPLPRRDPDEAGVGPRHREGGLGAGDRSDSGDIDTGWNGARCSEAGGATSEVAVEEVLGELRAEARRTVSRLLALRAADPGALTAARAALKGGGAMMPRHVANALWAAASLEVLSPLRRCGTSAVAAERESVDGGGGGGGAVQAGAIAWVERAVAATRGALRSDSFDEEGISQVVWAVSKLGLTPDAGWMEDFYGAAGRKAPKLSSYSAANVLLSVARMAAAAVAATVDAEHGVSDVVEGDELGAAADLIGLQSRHTQRGAAAMFHPPSDAWLSNFLADTTPTLRSADSVSLTNSAWALAALLRTARTVRHPAGSQLPPEMSPPPPICWLQSFYDALSQPGALALFTDTLLGLLLGSLAGVAETRQGGLPRVPSDALLAAAAAALRARLGSMSDKSFAMASWGLERLQAHRQQRMETLDLRRGEQRLMELQQQQGATQARQRDGGGVTAAADAEAASWQAAWLQSAARRMPYMSDRWLLLTLRAAMRLAPAAAGESWLAVATTAVLQPGDALLQPESRSQRHHGSHVQQRQRLHDSPTGLRRERLPQLLHALLLVAEACNPQRCCPSFVTEAVAAVVLTEATAAVAPPAGLSRSRSGTGADGSGGHDGAGPAASAAAAAGMEAPKSSWTVSELLCCGAALARVGYMPQLAWRRAFLARVMQMAKLSSPPPLAPYTPPSPPTVAAFRSRSGDGAPVASASGDSPADCDEAETAAKADRVASPYDAPWEPTPSQVLPPPRRHQLSAMDVTLLLSCAQRWAAAPSDATLAALLYGVQYEAWSPSAAARTCRLLALQHQQHQVGPMPPRLRPQPSREGTGSAAGAAASEPDHVDAVPPGTLSAEAAARAGMSGPPLAAVAVETGRRQSANPRVPGLSGVPSQPLPQPQPTAVAPAVAPAARAPLPPARGVERRFDGSGTAAESAAASSSSAAAMAPAPVGGGAATSAAPGGMRAAVQRDQDSQLGLGLGLDLDEGLGLGCGPGGAVASPVVARARDVVLVAPRPRPPAASGSRPAAGLPDLNGNFGRAGNGRADASNGGGGAGDDVVAVMGTDGRLSYSPGDDGAGPPREEVLQRGPGRPVGAAAAPAEGAVAVAGSATWFLAAAPGTIGLPRGPVGAAAAAATSYLSTWPTDSSGSDADGEAFAAVSASAAAAAAAAAAVMPLPGSGVASIGADARGGEGGAGDEAAAAAGAGREHTAPLRPPAAAAPQVPPAPPAHRFASEMLGVACASLERQFRHRMALDRTAPPLPPSPLPSARLDGRWSLLSLAQLLWAAARLRLRTTPRQRVALDTALTAALTRWSELQPHVLVPLLWACRRLGVRLGVGPARLLYQALLLHPGLQPAELSDGELFMLLEAVVGWRLDPPLGWNCRVPRRLGRWLLRASPAVAATAAAVEQRRRMGRRAAAPGAVEGGAAGVEARQLLLVMRMLRRLQLAARAHGVGGGVDGGGEGGGSAARRSSGNSPGGGSAGAGHSIEARSTMLLSLKPYWFRRRRPFRWLPTWAPVLSSKAAAQVLRRHTDRVAFPIVFITPFDEELWPELWPMLRVAVRRRLAELFGPRSAERAAAEVAAVAAASARERLAALMCGAACGLVDWEGWGVAALRRLAGELAPRDYHAWLALAVGLPCQVTRGSLEDLLLGWCIATAPHLDAMPPRQLHNTLRLAGRVAEALLRPMSFEWVSAALRRYSRCVGALPPAKLAQVPAVLSRLRRLPPPRWQMSYADLVLRRALPYMSGASAQAMLRGAAALSPDLAALLRGPVHEHQQRLWLGQRNLARRRQLLAARRRMEHEERRRLRLRWRWRWRLRTGQ